MWNFLFIASIAQGVFFLLLLLMSKKHRTNATRYLCLLLVLFLITDVDYYFIASGYYDAFPWLFGISNGLMMLMGPTLYLYARSLLLGTTFTRNDILHFVPYAIFLVFSFPLFTMSLAERILFIDIFISGNLPLRSVDYAIFALQVLHLAIYLFFVIKTFKLHRLEARQENESWIRSLVIFLFGYGGFVLVLVIIIFTTGKYSLTANYSYALACSLMLYLVTAYALLNPNVPFGRTRKSRKLLDREDVELYWVKVISLMENDKVFVDAEIRMQDVAEKAGLKAHQLSQLINEQSGKTFSDFVNYYRVEEFKRRISQPDSDQFTLVGLAFEIGFNSKTTFNNAFKKFTGTTPSEYKRNLR